MIKSSVSNNIKCRCFFVVVGRSRNGSKLFYLKEKKRKQVLISRKNGFVLCIKICQSLLEEKSYCSLNTALNCVHPFSWSLTDCLAGRQFHRVDTDEMSLSQPVMSLTLCYRSCHNYKRAMPSFLANVVLLYFSPRLVFNSTFHSY